MLLNSLALAHGRNRGFRYRRTSLPSCVGPAVASTVERSLRSRRRRRTPISRSSQRPGVDQRLFPYDVSWRIRREAPDRNMYVDLSNCLHLKTVSLSTMSLSVRTTLMDGHSGLCFLKVSIIHLRLQASSTARKQAATISL